MKNALFCLALIATSSTLFAQEDIIADAVPVEATAEPSTGESRPLTAAVELFTKTTIAGTLVDNAQIEIKTAFGEVSVPMSEVAGVRFASSEDPTTTIVMLNGDSVTGATNVKAVEVETEWGTAKINGSAVQSILLVPDLQWTASQGINGRRWNLVEKSKTQAAAAATQPSTGRVQSSGVTRSPNGIIYQGR